MQNIWSSCKNSIDKIVDIGKIELQTRITAVKCIYTYSSFAETSTVQKEHYNIVPEVNGYL